MRYLVVAHIQSLAKGTVVKLRGLYLNIYASFPSECHGLGLTASYPVEQKWQKDIRWGLQDAKHNGLIKHIGQGKSGRWERI
jgi:hypothetical protein